jgi:hypothetical protein
MVRDNTGMSRPIYRPSGRRARHIALDVFLLTRFEARGERFSDLDEKTMT